MILRNVKNLFENQKKNIVELILQRYSDLEDWEYLLKQCDEQLYEELVKLYSTYLLSFSLIGREKEEMIDELLNYSLDGVFRIVDARFEDPEGLDFDFHILHCVFPDIRKDAIKLIGEETGDVLSVLTEVLTRDDDGETYDVTPVIEKIKKELKHLDVVVKFRETYRHDHEDRMFGFRSENLVVEIYALDEYTKERAKEIIKKVAGIIYEY